MKIKQILNRGLEKYAEPRQPMGAAQSAVNTGGLLSRAGIKTPAGVKIPQIKPPTPQATQQAVQPKVPQVVSQTNRVGFNKPNAHYSLPQIGTTSPAGSSPWRGQSTDFTASTPHAEYLSKVKQQYPYTDDQPPTVFNALRKAPDSGAAQKMWQDYVDAHPVADNFKAPAATWFGDDLAATTAAREQALQNELPTPTAPAPQRYSAEEFAARGRGIRPVVSQGLPGGQYTRTMGGTYSEDGNFGGENGNSPAVNQPAPAAPVPNVMKPPQAPPTPAPVQPANQAPQTSPANDKMPKLIEHAQATLAAAKTPEAKAEAEKQLVPNVTAQIKETATPETVDAASRVMQGDAEAAAPARDNFITDQAGGDPTKTQDPTWYGQAMGMWDGLGPTGQAAFMVGVPAALISLLSGDGLMGILGGLGIGALGVGAGAMGMLGENTQAGMGRMLGDAANFFDVIPDEARDSKMFAPGADAAVKQKIQDAIKAAPQGQGAAVGQQMLDAERAKFDQLQQLHATNPELANSYLMGMNGEYAPKTREEAAALFSRLQQQYDETGQQGYLYNQALQAAQKERDAKLQEAINGGEGSGALGWGEFFGVDTDAAADAAMHAGLAERGFFAPTTGKETRASMNIAQKIVLKHAALKAARCWEGYEPVPGKEPYSNNSCRPAGSKSKKKKTEKKAAQPVSQFSQTAFDRPYAEAAFKQHGIHFSPKSTDQQLYNLYTRKGTVRPGQKMNPFQSMVGAHHGYLPPAPLQPSITPRPATRTPITPHPAPSTAPASSVASVTPVKAKVPTPVR